MTTKARAKAPDPAPDAPIEVRIRKANDWIIAVACAPGFLTCIWAAVGFADLHASDLQETRYGSVLVALLNLIGPAGFQLIATFAAYVCGVYGYGAAWRLFKPSPAITATAEGLSLHPSIHPKPVAWEDVTWMGITGSRPSKLTFRVRSRFWASNNPLMGNSVHIAVAATGWSHRTTQSNLKRMRQWKRNAAKA